MNETKIEWTDLTWNPVTGCRNDCPYCYARRISARRGWSFEPTFWPERLTQPQKEKRPRKIFVCSMGELFGEWVEKAWIEKVLAVVQKCPQHTFQFLTKNPKGLAQFNPWPKNAWVGATATNQAMASVASMALVEVSAAIRYLSCEPLLGSIRLHGANHLRWIIIGAQTGPGGIQPQGLWVRMLIDDARRIGANVFCKDNLIWSHAPKEMPTGLARGIMQLRLDGWQAATPKAEG